MTPASLKTVWEDQIQQFTELPYQLVFGHRLKRLPAYDSAPFFTIVNYEQMLADGLDVNARLNPDIVVLGEAQRIKNWSTKTSQAIKRLVSRYVRITKAPTREVDPVNGKYSEATLAPAVRTDVCLDALLESLRGCLEELPDLPASRAIYPIRRSALF